MIYFLDTIRSLSYSLRNAFRPPTTVNFPTVRRPRPERFRTSFALRHGDDGDELCIGCRACEKICPSQVITVELEKGESPAGKKRGYSKVFVLDVNACIFCELCVQVCPTDAIVMTKVAADPAFSREALCLNKERLYENERNMPLSWGRASRLADGQQGPDANKKVKEEPSDG